MGQMFDRLGVVGLICVLFVGAPLPLSAQQTQPAEGKGQVEVTLCPSCYCGPDYDCYQRGMLELQRGEFSLAIGGRVQVQVAPYVGSDALLQQGDPAENAGFRLRRARLYIGGNIIEMVRYHLEAEFAKGEMFDTPLLEAWMTIEPWEFLKVAIGLMKMPFSRYQLSSSAELGLIERPLGARGMAPSRQLGILIEGKVWKSRIHYAVGAYNSLKRATTFYEGYQPLGGHIGNRLSRLAYAARLELHPLGEVSSGLTDPRRSPLRFAVGAGYLFNDARTVRTHLVGADLILKWNGLSFVCEFGYDMNEPSKDPNTAATISGEQDRMYLAGHIAYVLPWLPLEVVVGAELLDTNRDIDDEGDELVISGGLNYYVVRNMLKAQLIYSHRREQHGRAVENDLFLVQFQVAF